MSDAVNILRKAASVEKAPLFEPYSKVIIHVGLSEDGDKEIVYEAGDDTGRTLEINNEWGTQMMANTILTKIKGYQYQPFSASSAFVDPSVELGDGITVNGIYSGIFVQATTFNSLMASDVSAPVDEEIEHEYGFESKTDRAYTRMVAQTRSGISLSADAIAAEVARATDAEGELSSRITVNAESITAEVSRATSAEGTLRSSINQNAESISAEVRRATSAEGSKLDHTYSNSSFGWQLTSNAFILKSNNQEVFKANKDGITVKGNGEFTGKITATSGYIGNESNGFTISNRAIYNGMTSLGDTQHNGVYVGTDGISIGKGAFKVTSAGAVTATNLAITGGSINIGNAFQVDSRGNLTATSGTFSGNVYAGNIQYGGNYGTFNGAGLTPYSVSGGYGGQIGSGTIIGGNVASYTLTGGTSGNLDTYTVSYGNTAFTGTLDQVGTNRSNIEALASYFNTAYANAINAYTVRARDALYYQGYLVRLYTVKDTSDTNRTVLGLY